MASITPWRQLLLESIQANKHLKHSQYFQLATVKENGRPANRTVVYRGFIEGTEKLQFTTDARSQKIEEIKGQPFGEICWYFTDSREQFRIGGFLDVIGHGETNPVRLGMRERVWFQSSPGSRLQFVGPTPGVPCVEGGPHDSSAPQLDPAQGPVENFCLVTLEPHEAPLTNDCFTRLRKDAGGSGDIKGGLRTPEKDEEILLPEDGRLFLDTRRSESVEFNL